MSTESFMDQIKAFGARLGLPKVDVDKLVDIQLKNIDALGRSAQTAGEGAKALADKQREIIEAAFKETSAMDARPLAPCAAEASCWYDGSAVAESKPRTRRSAKFQAVQEEEMDPMLADRARAKEEGSSLPREWRLSSRHIF